MTKELRKQPHPGISFLVEGVNNTSSGTHAPKGKACTSSRCRRVALAVGAPDSAHPALISRPASERPRLGDRADDSVALTAEENLCECQQKEYQQEVSVMKVHNCIPQDTSVSKHNISCFGLETTLRLMSTLR